MIHDQINQGIELCGMDIRQDTGVVWQGDPYLSLMVIRNLSFS